MPTLLIAAHGTRDTEGEQTVRALADAVAAARPSTTVSLCYLDVLAPTLGDALAGLDGPVVVVPLLLSAGYHVTTDIPAIVAGSARVRVARHLGPDPLVLDALVDRLGPVPARPVPDGPVLLAAVASSRDTARDEIDAAAALLADRLGRDVDVLPIGGDLTRAIADRAPAAVSTYLLAPGLFSRQVASAGDAHGVPVAPPIGVHPALISLVWQRYDEALSSGAGAGVR